MNIKYSIIAPIYKRRKEQLLYSLKSYNDQTVKDIFELVLIDQGNDENIEELFTKYPVKIKHIKVDLDRVGYSNCFNPTYAQNVGFKNSSGEYYILTSPEVVFEYQAFEKIESKVSKDVFLYCSVTESAKLDLNRIYDYNYLVSTKSYPYFNGWLCHSTYRRELLAYFLGVIHRDIVFRLSGMDEDFMYGIGFDDNDFGQRTSQIIKPFFCDDIVGAHLSHCRNYQVVDRNKINYAIDLWHKKLSVTPYPLVANQDRIWGDPKGIISINHYNY